MRTDPSDNSDADIRMAYHSIAQKGTLNWLLLSYGKWAGGLKLFAAGSQGVQELKKHVTDDNVYFAFCRETDSGRHFYVTIAYIPEGVSGLRRTRAVSTSRTVQSWFKTSQAMLTLSNLDDLTSESLVQVARVDEIHNPIPTMAPVSRSSSDHNDNTKALPCTPDAFGSIRRSESASPEGPNSLRKPGWSRFLSDFGNPEERAKRRQEAQLRQMTADEVAAKEETLRQARIKREKAEILRRHDYEELSRRQSLEQELKKAAQIKAEKEERERSAAQQRTMARELKKRVDAEKRLAESQRIEAWRREKQQYFDNLARQEEAERQSTELAKEAARMTALQVREERNGSDDYALLEGWITVQNTSTLAWRRRWFKLDAAGMKLYKSDKDLNRVIDTIELAGKISNVKEWSDGFEELRAIPHSFAITFRGDQDTVFMFADSVQVKIELTGFLLTYI